MTAASLRRGGRTCGLFFQVLGPLRQKAYAVWAGDEHRLLFYDAIGVRVTSLPLTPEKVLKAIREQKK